MLPRPIASLTSIAFTSALLILTASPIALAVENLLSSMMKQPLLMT